MRDPFKIDGPACISFSGGRTSAYMLWRILQAWDGKLPDDVVVCFANTGKEMEETLRFVERCSKEWDVPIAWLEYENAEEISNRWKLVTFETASRNGEPFEKVITVRQYLPNPVTRFCTSEMKIRPIACYLRHIGFEGTKTDLENMAVVGIRADEPRRAAKIGIDRTPLVSAGITAEHVGAFFAQNSFDLELPNMNGKTMHGNCDLCFLKGAQQTQALISEKPERALWWAKMEALALALASKPSGAIFRKDRPSYRQMYEYALAQNDWIGHGVPDETIPCFCGD